MDFARVDKKIKNKMISNNNNKIKIKQDKVNKYKILKK